MDGSTRRQRVPGNPAPLDRPYDPAPISGVKRWEMEVWRDSHFWEEEPIAVAEVMTRDIKCAPPHARLSELATIMRDHNVGAVPVVDDEGRLLGLVTDRDIVVRGCVNDGATDGPCARDVMTGDLVVVSPCDRFEDLLLVIADRRVQRVPVVDAEARLVGIVSLGDLARRCGHRPELLRALQELAQRHEARAQGAAPTPMGNS